MENLKKCLSLKQGLNLEDIFANFLSTKQCIALSQYLSLQLDSDIDWGQFIIWQMKKY